MTEPTNPPVPPKGGSRFGWSYLSVASDCPTKWFLRNLAPWPGSGVVVDPITRHLSMDGARELPISGQGDDSTPLLPVGLESKRFSPALDTGSRFHLGLEAYYRSGLAISGDRLVDTRQRDLDAAISGAAVGMSPEPTEPELESLSVAQRLLRGYVAHYGGDSDVEVVVLPDNTPGVELELWLDLGHQGYQFTSRLDLVYRKAGYLWALEHKTTAASALGKLINRFSIDGQVTGQFLQLVSHFPDEPIGGVTLNAAVKDRGAKSDLPSFSRRDYSRTPAQLEKFRLDAIRKLRQIDLWVEEWLELVAKGMSFEDAALAVFDGTPNGTQCVGMGFACEFLQICQRREVAGRLLLDSYQPREYRDSWSNPLRTRRS